MKNITKELVDLEKKYLAMKKSVFKEIINQSKLCVFRVQAFEELDLSGPERERHGSGALLLMRCLDAVNELEEYIYDDPDNGVFMLIKDNLVSLKRSIGALISSLEDELKNPMIRQSERFQSMTCQAISRLSEDLDCRLQRICVPETMLTQQSWSDIVADETSTIKREQREQRKEKEFNCETG